MANSEVAVQFGSAWLAARIDPLNDRISLLVIGYAWMVSIPSTLHGQETYIDENALQPGQVKRSLYPQFSFYRG